MVKLYVPFLGDKLKLTADWRFKIYNLRSGHQGQYTDNIPIYSLLCSEPYRLPSGVASSRIDEWKTSPNSYKEVTIPAGCVLTYSRAIRHIYEAWFAGARTYPDGSTRKEIHLVRLKLDKNLVLGNRRQITFEVFVEDANNIEFEPI